MAIWIASGNRENWEVVKTHNIWGVPKRSKNLHTRVKAGDTILMYARSETRSKKVVPFSSPRRVCGNRALLRCTTALYCSSPEGR